MGDSTRLPLPEPIWTSNGQTVLYRHGDVERIVAANAKLREQVRALREVVESAAAADVFKDSPGAMDRLAEYARSALEKTS